MCAVARAVFISSSWLVGKCSFLCRSADTRSLWRTLAASFFPPCLLFCCIFSCPSTPSLHLYSPSLLLSLSCLLSLIITALCSFSLFITSKLSSQFTSNIYSLSSGPISVRINYSIWVKWQHSIQGQSIALSTVFEKLSFSVGSNG